MRTEQEFYRDKVVLVTGATGYLGSVLVEKLQPLAREVRPLQKRLIDQDWTKTLDGVDIIFHLAAQTNAPMSNAMPVTEIRHFYLPVVDMMRTIQASYPHIRVIFAGSATQYGKTDVTTVCNEDSLSLPSTFYDVMKCNIEDLLTYYAQEHNIRTKTLRLTNVYGPSTAEEKSGRGFINGIVKKVVANEPVSIDSRFTDRMRDFLFITDAVEAFVKVPMIQILGGYYLICSGKSHTYEDVFYWLAQLKDLHFRPMLLMETLQVDERNFRGDPSLFRLRYSWQPEVNLPEGLKLTVEYYEREIKEVGRAIA